jgi:MFS family permease
VSDPRYARYVLGILFLVYVVNFIDRQILAVLLDPIKEEIGATDTQMGFLTGLAFALFYTGFGIPIARWADRGTRRTIIGLGLTVWSLMTAACGLVQSFAQLAVARVGVGVGEAAGTPPAHSMISDYFPPEKRVTAFSIYNFGIPVGVMLGYLGGGWMVEFFDWRTAFFAAAAPGLVLAVVLRLTVREPVRGASDPEAMVPDELAGTSEPSDPEAQSTREALRTLLSIPTFAWTSVGSGFSAFAAYGFGAWVPAFLGRVHGMGHGEIGTWVGLESGIAGVIGMIATGIITDRLAPRDARWYIWIPIVSIVLYLPFSVMFLLWPEPTVALIAYIVPVALSSVYLAPLLALSQRLVGLRLRALSSAVSIFILNLIGMGLGPQAVGLLSDWFRPEYGDESLRWALLIALSMKGAAIFCYFVATLHVRADIAKREQLDALGHR